MNPLDTSIWHRVQDATHELCPDPTTTKIGVHRRIQEEAMGPAIPCNVRKGNQAIARKATHVRQAAAQDGSKVPVTMGRPCGSEQLVQRFTGNRWSDLNRTLCMF